MRAGRTPGRQDCLRRAGGRLDCPRPPSLAGSGSVSAHCWRGTSESMAAPRRTPWRPGRALAGVLLQMTRIGSPTYLLSYRFGGPPSRRPGGRQGGLSAPWLTTGALLQEPDSDASGASPGRRPRPLPTITWALARTVLLRASWRAPADARLTKLLTRLSIHQAIDSHAQQSLAAPAWPRLVPCVRGRRSWPRSQAVHGTGQP